MRYARSHSTQLLNSQLSSNYGITTNISIISANDTHRPAHLHDFVRQTLLALAFCVATIIFQSGRPCGRADRRRAAKRTNGSCVCAITCAGLGMIRWLPRSGSGTGSNGSEQQQPQSCVVLRIVDVFNVGESFTRTRIHIWPVTRNSPNDATIQRCGSR